MLEERSSSFQFFILAIGIAILSFFLLNKNARGRKTFYILFGILFALNLSHFIYLKSLPPPTTKYGGFNRGFGYFMAMILEMIILIGTAVVWRIVYQMKKKKKTNISLDSAEN